MLADSGTRSIRSVERAIDVLYSLECASHPMGLSELGRAVGMPKATVLRLLGVLMKRGLAEKVLGRYQIGVGTVPMAHAFLIGSSLSKAALPVMQELAVATEETISLFVRLGFSRVIVQRVEGKHPLRYVLPVGQRLPLHLGAGKILAAAMSDEEVHEMLGQVGDIRRADGEMVTAEAFMAELQQVRKQGFSISINERTLGTASVCAPVVGPDGSTLAVISIIGPTDCVTPDKIPQFSIEVRHAARAIAERYRSL